MPREQWNQVAKVASELLVQKLGVPGHRVYAEHLKWPLVGRWSDTTQDSLESLKKQSKLLTANEQQRIKKQINSIL